MTVGPNIISSNQTAMYYLICQDLFEMKEYFIFSWHLSTPPPISRGYDRCKPRQCSGEQENHDSALLLGMNCQVL